ncbi:unnamed protein product [Miscanthus lutarioriparius]|uniref:Uncharacterized protein n=1 Tax=Miscanthus lutarioriparius TaxID=422564 RepID=A0A811PSG2_9POAL|nr:unnamed protein product [Miscanthus lutarioriparius]
MAGPGVADHESPDDPDQQVLGWVSVSLSSLLFSGVFVVLLLTSSSSLSSKGGIHPTRKAKGSKGKQAKIPNSFQIDPPPVNPIQQLSLGIGFMRIRPLPLAAA